MDAVAHVDHGFATRRIGGVLERPGRAGQPMTDERPDAASEAVLRDTAVHAFTAMIGLILAMGAASFAIAALQARGVMSPTLPGDTFVRPTGRTTPSRIRLAGRGCQIAHRVARRVPPPAHRPVHPVDRGVAWCGPVRRAHRARRPVLRGDGASPAPDARAPAIRPPPRRVARSDRPGVGRRPGRLPRGGPGDPHPRPGEPRQALADERAQAAGSESANTGAKRLVSPTLGGRRSWSRGRRRMTAPGSGSPNA